MELGFLLKGGLARETPSRKNNLKIGAIYFRFCGKNL